MRIFSFLLALSFWVGLSAPAAAAPRRRPAAVGDAEPIATTTAGAATAKTVRHIIRPNRWGWTAGALLWQEKIKITSGNESGSILTQSSGLQGGVVYEHPLRSLRWNTFYNGLLQIGALRAAGTTTIITDTFKDNRWYALQAAAGLMYRTTSVSSVSLVVPITYRYIAWEIGASSASRPDRKTSPSIGYSGVFTTQFNARNSLNFAFTHQQLWEATQWTISFVRLL